MLDEWAEELGIDLNSPSSQRANYLVEQDNQLLVRLRELRKERGLTHAQVGERLGWSEAQVREFEAYYHDPRLSEIRRYAHAIGALVSHETSLDPAGDSGD